MKELLQLLVWDLCFSFCICLSVLNSYFLLGFSPSQNSSLFTGCNFLIFPVLLRLRKVRFSGSICYIELPPKEKRCTRPCLRGSGVFKLLPFPNLFFNLVIYCLLMLLSLQMLKSSMIFPEFLSTLISYGKGFPRGATCQNLLRLHVLVRGEVQLTFSISSWDFR